MYGGISSYLHNERQTTLKKAFIAIENQVNLQSNNVFYLEDSINTVHNMHNKTTLNETLFVGKLNNWYQWYLS